MYLQYFKQNNDNQHIVSASGHVVLTWSVGPAARLCQSAARVQHLQRKSQQHLPGYWRLRCVDLSERIIINALFDMSNLQAVDTDLITLSTDVNGEKLVVPFQDLEWSFIRLLQRFADRVVSDEDVRALKQILGDVRGPLLSSSRGELA